MIDGPNGDRERCPIPGLRHERSRGWDRAFLDEPHLPLVVPAHGDPDAAPTHLSRTDPWPWCDFGRMWCFGFVLLPSFGRS